MSQDAATPSRTSDFTSAERTLGVVVGFDGSNYSKLALHYGARSAQRRGSALTVVTSFTIAPGVYATLAAVPRIPDEQLKYQATKPTLDLARELLEDYPGEVTYLAEEGDAAGILVEKSQDAQLVVVGGRGLGGFLGLLLGSVASALPAYAKSPTVIIPGNYDDGEGTARFAPVESSGPVVVGIDGSAHSRTAVLQAARAASERGVTLQILMVLPPLDGALLWYPELTNQVDEVTQQRRAELQETVDAERDWLKDHFPDLEVSTTVEPGDPVSVLRKKSRTAQLIVVGTRGLGGLRSTMLGSVSRGLLLRGEGPVMVVPQPEEA
ncbi:universal stress protein [Nesterenkonia salmonea]|uniref:Universal stress protein n=1 Tax=Nesterenkonia salmonea TaxID=1804987 RepID=A0A5R9B8K4_9MICC|nr:universal stress protein [Nesterenkonia salmonea]TLP92891.1 universal stress protein [Nesterenkonia salmonea]